ncbi:hypothetical protein NT239_05095 [Chitinibacter sp. SCUT-21]|uniref:hypothetical protein n=1 Tax=Chitinibacter sp. SCUT-21 TaxID=2970891 RepID=UPI0035A6B27B
MKSFLAFVLMACLHAQGWANQQLDEGQQRVTQEIEAWNSCIRHELKQQIQSIASPAFIAETTLDLCNANYLRLQQLMMDDMQKRGGSASAVQVEKMVIDSLKDAKDNHRAKIISIVLKYRAK